MAVVAAATAPVRSKRSKWAEPDSPAKSPTQPLSSALPPPPLPPPVLPPPPYPPHDIGSKAVEGQDIVARDKSPAVGTARSPGAIEGSGLPNTVASNVWAVGEKSRWADNTPPASPARASPAPARSRWAHDSPGSPTAAAVTAQDTTSGVKKSAAARSKWADDSPVAASPSAKADSPAFVGDKADAEGLIRAAKATGDAGAALDLLETGLRGAGRVTGNDAGDAMVVEVEGGGEGGEFGGPEDGADGEGDEAGAAGAAGGPAESLRQGNGLHRCREVDKAYQKLNKIDEGTYGVVYRARLRSSLARLADGATRC